VILFRFKMKSNPTYLKVLYIWIKNSQIFKKSELLLEKIKEINLT